MFKGIEGPLVLIVLDGVGEVEAHEGNAVLLAHTPNLNGLRSQHRFTPLAAHGKAVGLASNKDMGNSEVGHNALGAGQIYDQGAKLVADAIATGLLYRGGIWQQAINQVRANTSTLHFIGLLSDGNVHSHIDHLLSMLDKAVEQGVLRARIHTLLDGRDVSGTSAHLYLDTLERFLAGHQAAGRDFRIASGGGRMKVTMDRYEAEWDMVQRGWDLHVHGKGPAFKSAMEALEHYRTETPGILDQDLGGFVVHDGDGPVGTINDGDSVIFFNFRGDRAIEISRAFEEGDEFTAIDRGPRPNVFYAGMMQYDGDTCCPNHYLVNPPNIANTLSDFLAEARVPQYAISETQKYGHITYFWNGNRSGYTDEATETFVEIPSDAVPFEQRPWMKAAEITDELLKAISSGKHRFLRVNYANGDMVGHTGDLNAAITAMSCLDLQLGRLMKAITKAKGVAVITADHGNCDEMFETDKKGQTVMDDDGKPKPKTSHTLSPVPFILFDPCQQIPGNLHRGTGLGIGNVTATAAQIIGLEPPKIWEPGLLTL